MPAGSAISPSYAIVGNTLKARGDLAGALKSYEAKHAIIDRLAKADPDNTGWQSDLSLSYIWVGDVLVARGNLDGALKSYHGQPPHFRTPDQN